MTRGTMCKLFELNLGKQERIISYLWTELNRRLPKFPLPCFMMDTRRKKKVKNSKEFVDDHTSYKQIFGNINRLYKNDRIEGKPIKFDVYNKHYLSKAPIHVTAFLLKYENSKGVKANYVGTGQYDKYLTQNEAIFHIVNGKVYAHKGISTLKNKTDLEYLSGFLIVFLDYSDVPRGKRSKDIFMASRDRICKDADDTIMPIVYTQLKEHPILRKYNEKYRSKDLVNRKNNQTVNDLKGFIKNNPEFLAFFNQGTTLNSGIRVLPGETTADETLLLSKFEGRDIPTFLNIANTQYDLPINSWVKVNMTTDAKDEYIDDVDNYTINCGRAEFEVGTNPILHDGKLTLIIRPTPQLQIGDTHKVAFSLIADGRVLPVSFTVTAVDAKIKISSPPGDNPYKDKIETLGLALPFVQHVRKGDKEYLEYGFHDNKEAHIIDRGVDTPPDVWLNQDARILELQKSLHSYTPKEEELIVENYNNSATLMSMVQVKFQRWDKDDEDKMNEETLSSIVHGGLTVALPYICKDLK